jgi:hypothetical protein
MRLLILFIGLALPMMAHSQSLRVYAGGGLIVNTTTNDGYGLEEKVAFPSGGAGQLAVGYCKGKWEYGLGVSYRRYSIRHYGTLYFEDEFDPLTGFTNKRGWPADVREKLPCIAATPFVNRHFTSGRTDLYGGVSIGYSYIYDQNVEQWQGFKLAGKRDIGGGLTGDVHVGCAFKIWRGLAVRSELSLGGLWMKEYNLESGMLTAGLQYNIK